MPHATVHTFPAAYALQLVTLIERWGLTAEALLSPVGLVRHELEAPEARIPAASLRDLSERARTLTGEPGLGFYLGLQKRLSMYGYVGFATMHAATVRESLELMVRYTPALTTGLSMELQVAGDLATLVVHEHFDMGSARDIAVFSFLVGSRQLTSSMTGRPARHSWVDVPLPKPSYFDRFAHLLPNARFGRPVVRIAFPARGLDVPLVTPDRAALRLAQAACEKQLQALGFACGLPARVRDVLAQAETFPSVESTARTLRMSGRTLKRKLATDGVTFSALLDQERRQRAETLLRTTELSLDEIARRLDYSTPPNFARAFRRWTGQTPAAYRRRRS